jgi:hypothetical protein
MHKDRRGYSYKTRRDGERVTREYIGGAASISLRIEQNKKEAQSQERAIQEKRRLDDDALDTVIGRLCDETTAITHNALEAVGYHRRKSEKWRKRHKSKRGSMTNQSAAIEKLRAKAEIAATKSELKELIRRASGGDKAAAKRFFELKDAAPDGSLTQYGDIHRIVQETLLHKICKKDLITHETMKRHMTAMAQDLAGPQASPLEMMLAQRIALCYFHLYYCDNIAILNDGNEAWTNADDKMQQKRIDAANKRYLAATKTLAQVQRLNLPDVQINVGEKQVNIGTFNTSGTMPNARENQALASLQEADAE